MTPKSASSDTDVQVVEWATCIAQAGNLPPGSEPGQTPLLEAVLDCCAFGIAVFDANRRLAFANAAYYRLLNLPAEVFPPSSCFRSIVTFMAERGDIIGGARDHIVLQQTRLAECGEPHTFHRSRQNGNRMAISGQPLPCGGFVRTYFDVTQSTEDAWKMQSQDPVQDFRTGPES